MGEREWVYTCTYVKGVPVRVEVEPGVGGTPLYGLYRYVQPQRIGFFSRFGHK